MKECFDKVDIRQTVLSLSRTILFETGDIQGEQLEEMFVSKVNVEITQMDLLQR